jgi:hypothetical protein
VREIRTLRAMWRALETGLRKLLTRARRWKHRIQPRRFLRIYAPALDPTPEVFAASYRLASRVILLGHDRLVFLSGS